MKKPEETIEILTKEIESLNSIEAHDLVLFYYKINHEHFKCKTYLLYASWSISSIGVSGSKNL